MQLGNGRLQIQSEVALSDSRPWADIQSLCGLGFFIMYSVEEQSHPATLGDLSGEWKAGGGEVELQKHYVSIEWADSS